MERKTSPIDAFSTARHIMVAYSRCSDADMVVTMGVSFRRSLDVQLSQPGDGPLLYQLANNNTISGVRIADRRMRPHTSFRLACRWMAIDGHIIPDHIVDLLPPDMRHLPYGDNRDGNVARDWFIEHGIDLAPLHGMENVRLSDGYALIIHKS